MATITTLNPNDSGAVSRGVINTNVTNLNTDKIETAVISTDGTLLNNSDTKLPSERAVKTYVDNEIADVGVTTAATIFPMPGAGIDFTQPKQTLALTGNTTARVGQVVIPFKITVNKISIFVNSTVATPGTVDLALYSEDGQTRLFSVTTASLTASTLFTTAVASVVVPAGIYYSYVSPNSTTNASLMFWLASTSGLAPAALSGGVASEPIMAGTITVTADTPPVTISPTGITAATVGALVFRLDN